MEEFFSYTLNNILYNFVLTFLPTSIVYKCFISNKLIERTLYNEKISCFSCFIGFICLYWYTWYYWQPESLH